jgi:hypothetical protein
VKGFVAVIIAGSYSHESAGVLAGDTGAKSDVAFCLDTGSGWCIA